MKKIIVMGLGNIFREYEKEIYDRYEVIGVTSNYRTEAEMFSDFILPAHINNHDYDHIMICSMAEKELANQLICMGVKEEKILLARDVFEKESDLDIGGTDSEQQKVIKINFTDFWSDFKKDSNFILNFLSDRYTIELSDEPDIIFCSHFGEKHKDYKNSIKVFIETEVMPYDARCFDYIAGFGYSESERFCHYNLYAPRRTDGIQDRSRFSDFTFAKRKFCNFVYSNETRGGGAAIRKQFCMELSRYKHIDCPGKVLNNMQNAIVARESAEWNSGRLAFIGKYKFTIAFENHMADGYTTEKLWGPLSVGSIPIYWGNPQIGREVDSEAFINCNEFDNDFEEVIKRVKEIDADEERYMYMLQKAPLKSNFDSGYRNFRLFLDRIISQI